MGNFITNGKPTPVFAPVEPPSRKAKVGLAAGLVVLVAVGFNACGKHDTTATATPAAPVTTVTTVAPAPTTTAAPTTTVFSMPDCTDLGDGEVWIGWEEILDCDVQPGQILSYTDVPADGQADCAYYGGEYMAVTADEGICYGVDF